MLINSGKDIDASDKWDNATIRSKLVLLTMASLKLLPNGWQAIANSQPTLKTNLKLKRHSGIPQLDMGYDSEHLLP